MAIDEAERMRLAPLIVSRRRRLFGTKKRAYIAAEVNSATWDKAEAGESVRLDLFGQIVRTLWPETEGDWTAIGVVTGDAELSVEARLTAIEERLDRLMGVEPPDPPEDESSETRSKPA